MKVIKHQAGILTCAIFILSGCAPMVNTPVASRTTHPDMFELIKAGRIDPSKVQAVADCIHDGFAGAHGIFSNSTFRMNRRAGGYRIETTVGSSIVLVSADVMDDGAVELRENKNATLINTKSERQAFDTCTSTFPITTPK